MKNRFDFVVTDIPQNEFSKLFKTFLNYDVKAIDILNNRLDLSLILLKLLKIICFRFIKNISNKI